MCRKYLFITISSASEACLIIRSYSRDYMRVVVLPSFIFSKHALKHGPASECGAKEARFGAIDKSFIFKG